MIKQCNCSHVAQDQIYGRGNRLWNHQPKKNTITCTVCGTKVFHKTDEPKAKS